ncbi:tellurite resistance TerB family protein [Nostoc sp. FACHB-87]|uniref:tellurite resistance TerB family protein n=1 Tax=Nostocales TaxID=1161 RepID=UPI0016842414|nr:MULTISPECIES: tellurite resistance TerB family protein [Nostocales]MBD2453599.1 tellurite resistance TerB family protein [Nostoc sp. FACHB-87]MBD2475725.1 tellurite resistance TerB family protein [Anabaena sp. FACHB-83]MBD2492244.1 tellurite resistance TerB family protein [Aulosira sp. FACHB-615]
MNLVDKILGKENQASEKLTSAEAFAAIALVAVTSDAVLSEQQVHNISAVLSRLKLFSSYPEEFIKKLLEKNLNILRCDGFNALFNAAKESLSPELREVAFAVAADLVMTETVVTEEEKNFLNDLYLALDIPRDNAIKILQVLMVKNQSE